MRSWGNRPDTIVLDEPFYGLYLQRTGQPHPGAAEIISNSETDPAKIVECLVKELPAGRTIFYQKHMAHHLLPGIDRLWLNDVTNCFLIRDPAEVIVSYIRKNDRPAMQDLGFAQQTELFDSVRRNTGSIPPVIDAADVFRNPRRTLGLLCAAVGVEFNEAMLSWAAGFRETDGIWAKHWYAEVAKSTGFQPYRRRSEPVPEQFREIEAEARKCYERMYEYRLR
jgi:hypothetical protein